MSQKLTKTNLITLQLSQGMRLIEIYLINNDSDKSQCLDLINAEIGARYNVNHLNNWISGRKPTPERVKNICRLSMLADLFGIDGIALYEILYS